MDTLEEQVYDGLTHLAAQICSTPIALVSLIDTDRQWFKSHHGPEARETPREVAFCAHAILQEGVLCVIDNVRRSLSPAQLKSLQALARQVISLLDLRMKVSELEILDRAKSDFIAMVNHELRTPLSSVMVSLELLEKDRGQASGEVRSGKLVDTARRNTDRLLVIVNDILDIAKMEAGKFEIDSRPLDLVELLRNAVALNEGFVKKQGCPPAPDSA